MSPSDSLIHVTTVFEIHPVSGALEVFLFQRNNPCCDVKGSLRTLTFFCKWEEEDSEKQNEKGELAWALIQAAFRRINFRKMTCGSEGMENTLS